jgi:HAMP domain-containing protein
MKADQSVANYTVNLLYPLNDETVRQEAATKLVPALNLTLETVLKMLSRPPGPLTKPTTFENAERVAHHFISVGVPVEVGSIVPKPVVYEQSPVVPSPVNPSPASPSPVSPSPAGSFDNQPNPYQSVTNSVNTMPMIQSAPVSAPVSLSVAASSPALNMDGSIAKNTRRGSLKNNLVLLSLVPLLVFGIAIAGYLYSSLPQTSFDLVDVGMDRFVTSQALALHRDPDANAQAVFKASLQSLVNQKEYSLAMIDIEPGEGSVFKDIFVSAQPETSGVFEKDFDVFRETPEGKLRDATFSSSGFGQNTEKVTIIWADVYEETDGHRVIKFDNGSTITDGENETQLGKKIFRYNLGWLRQDSHNAAIQHVFLVIGILALGVLIAGLLATWFANRVSQPIIALTQAADRISLGELEIPITSNQNNELGDLAGAVERMRVSLKTAIERLRKRR